MNEVEAVMSESLNDFQRRCMEAVETAVEQAVQGGTCGVLVRRGPMWQIAAPDVRVPYGHVWWQYERQDVEDQP